MRFRINLVVALFFMFLLSALSVSVGAEQCLKGCPRELVAEGKRPEYMLRTLVDESDTIFVGTIKSIEPAVPDYPYPAKEGEPVDWKEYDKISDHFEKTNEITFAVESVWKGEKADTVKIRGGSLRLIFRHTNKFLIFVGKEDEDGIRLDVNKNIFRFVDVDHADYHWDVDPGKVIQRPWGLELMRGDKRLTNAYGPYVMKWDDNDGLWANGDGAFWTPNLKRQVSAVFAETDPRAKDPKWREEVFSLTTLGCQFTKDEWDRTGGSGFIGWEPCPMPVSFLEAYVKFLLK